MGLTIFATDDIKKNIFPGNFSRPESCHLVGCRGAKVKGDEENVSGHKSGFQIRKFPGFPTSDLAFTTKPF